MNKIFLQSRLCLLGVKWFGFVFLFVTPAFAKGAFEAAQDRASDIERQQGEKERWREIDLNRKLSGLPQATDKEIKQKISADFEREVPCIAVKHIIISGVTLIAEREIAALSAPFYGQCLGYKGLNKLLAVLTQLYIQRGYIAARAYLPEQDLGSGKLNVTIIEGKLETITENGSELTKAHQRAAFPNLIGRPVELRSLEQGLDQINRLRSNHMKLDLVKGRDFGYSQLRLMNQRGRRAYVSLSADNHGSDVTGRYRSRFYTSFDDILGIYDQWTISYQRSMERSFIDFTHECPHSDGVDLDISGPYGSWNFGIDGNWNRSCSPIKGLKNFITTSAYSLSFNPYISYLLFRDNVSKTILTGRIHWKKTTNFILKERINTTSRSLTIAGLDLSHSRKIGTSGANLYASIGVRQGVKLFGAFDDEKAPSGSPKGQFTLVNIYGDYSRPFHLGRSFDKPLIVYRAIFMGQATNDLLFGSEQFSLGGSGSTGGSREGILFGNNGFFLRHEISAPSAFSQLNPAIDFIKQFEPYLSLGTGHIFSDKKREIHGGNVMGATIGLRNRGSIFNFDMSFAQLLMVPQIAKKHLKERNIFHLRLSMAF